MDNKCVIGINEVDFGSTGNITFAILNYLKAKGFETYFACHEITKNLNNEFLISNSKINYLFNKIISRFDASDGFHSKHATKRLIKFLDSKKPSLLLIGNLHGSYINLPILFNYINRNKIPCVYTLHDCWTFTGKCSYFSECECYKWKKHCEHCPNLHTHPRAYFFDKSSKLFDKKRNVFSLIKDEVTFVTPSQWLCNCVKESFLREYKVKVINNGINENLNIVKLNSIDLEHENRIILFSAGMPLIERKGINFVNKLADELDSTKFYFISAGVPNELRKSKNICYLDLIKTREQMNYLYKNSDYFLNLSLEENFPSTNIESLQNGTPVIAFNSDGNTETINDKCGYIIQKKDYDSLKTLMLKLTKKSKIQSLNCFNKSKEYSSAIMCEKYYQLVSEILKKC